MEPPFLAAAFPQTSPTRPFLRDAKVDKEEGENANVDVQTAAATVALSRMEVLMSNVKGRTIYEY
jgi:hypothetical protein